MPDFTYPLVAIRADGHTITARTPLEAAAFSALRPGPSHVETATWIAALRAGCAEWRSCETHHDWIVRDDHGLTVRHADLPDDGVPRRGRSHRRAALVAAAAERGLPIPGTGGRRRYSSGFRRFAMNVAMRSAETGLGADLEAWGVPHARVGRLRSHGLPEVWDDVAYRNKRCSWKEHRATQYRTA